MMNDLLMHTMLSQISDLQDRVDALEDKAKVHQSWLESLQTTLERAHVEYVRLRELTEEHEQS